MAEWPEVSGKPLQWAEQTALDFGKPYAPRAKSGAVVALEQRLNHQHPATSPHYREDTTANGLTRCIIDFLQSEGWQAERINTMGRPITRHTPQGEIITAWMRTTGTVGSADISATIAGRSVKIEVKIGRDRQSQEQRKYQQSIEKAGGLYVIAKTFTGFVSWYNERRYIVKWQTNVNTTNSQQVRQN